MSGFRYSVGPWNVRSGAADAGVILRAGVQP